MKGTFFNKPLEWNIETVGESWQQGSSINGTLKVKNHGTETISLADAGVGLAYAEIKKIHARAEGALKLDATTTFEQKELKAGEEAELSFSFNVGPNSPVTDKKASYYLAYGRQFNENHLQSKIEPKALYTKIVGLLDTFHRFKQKEFKASKKGVEFKLLPPTSRDMANIESLNLTFSMDEDKLVMKYDFQVKKLDTSSVTTKINKESHSIEKLLAPKEYSLGKDMINQDTLLKSVEAVLSEVKLKNVY
ncbi:hypothetical protein [Peredibacter starrii]|uniref:Uncharacterized protein n=1 Tax=Peredibacter starrii TaxID=28202 RepID=A0AAX4HV51_9BACT|nr:hypothetical protein [Peredibacter starrii]WPU67032.1 hypothetical protein SOO65_09735 [Peredibacter starrii]